MSADLICNLIATLFVAGVITSFIILWIKERKRSAECLSGWQDAIKTGESLSKSNTAANNLIQDYAKALSEAEEKLKPKSIELPISPKWEGIDVQNLRNFFETSTGTKFKQRGRAMEYNLAVNGAKDQFHTVHSAGRSEGFGEALNWQDSLASNEMLQKLSQASGDTDANNTSSGEQDEAALLERP